MLFWALPSFQVPAIGARDPFKPQVLGAVPFTQLCGNHSTLTSPHPPLRPVLRHIRGPMCAAGVHDRVGAGPFAGRGLCGRNSRALRYDGIACVVSYEGDGGLVLTNLGMC